MFSKFDEVEKALFELKHLMAAKGEYKGCRISIFLRYDPIDVFWRKWVVTVQVVCSVARTRTTDKRFFFYRSALRYFVKLAKKYGLEVKSLIE